MKPEEPKLPNLENVEFLSKVFLKKEWYEDPPSFIWWKLKDEILLNVLQTKIKYLSELTKLEARAKELEGKMLDEISQKLR